MEGGADGVGSDLLQLAGDNGGEQESLQFCTFRLGGIAMGPTPLAYAFPAYPGLTRQPGLFLP